LRQDGVASVLVGATSPEQLAETTRASGVQLPPEAVAAIDSLFPLR